jgi:hypothetical protein
MLGWGGGAGGGNIRFPVMFPTLDKLLSSLILHCGHGWSSKQRKNPHYGRIFGNTNGSLAFFRSYIQLFVEIICALYVQGNNWQFFLITGNLRHWTFYSIIYA